MEFLKDILSRYPEGGQILKVSIKHLVSVNLETCYFVNQGNYSLIDKITLKSLTLAYNGSFTLIITI